MTVEAVDANSTWEAFNQNLTDVSTPNVSPEPVVIDLPNHGYAANEVSYDTTPVAQIQTNPCLASDVHAVSLMPGVDPKNNPIDTVELNEVEPAQQEGIAPITLIGDITYACGQVKDMVAANESGHAPAPQPVTPDPSASLKDQTLAARNAEQQSVYQARYEPTLEQPSGPSGPGGMA